MPVPLDSLLFVVLAVAVAAWLRPWRLLHGERAAAWLVSACATVVLWFLPATEVAGLALQWSGSCLLVLVAGWPMATLTLAGTALIATAFGDAHWLPVIDDLVWRGLLPALLALFVGWGVRHLLPRNPFVYVLARAFGGTVLIVAACGIARAASDAAVALPAGDVAIANVLLAFAEGTMTGMLAAALVAMRPLWLATYSDVLYAPPTPSAAVTQAGAEGP